VRNHQRPADRNAEAIRGVASLGRLDARRERIRSGVENRVSDRVISIALELAAAIAADAIAKLSIAIGLITASASATAPTSESTAAAASTAASTATATSRRGESTAATTISGATGATIERLLVPTTKGIPAGAPRLSKPARIEPGEVTALRHDTLTDRTVHDESFTGAAGIHGAAPKTRRNVAFRR
jgi:hypothetical protein